MKKLTLEFDELRVESFSTEGADDARGTVEGHIYYGSGVGCTAFYSCEDTVCAASCKAGGCGQSGLNTCGHYSRCNGDSIEVCWTDFCQG